jgi:hypothetical protein
MMRMLLAFKAEAKTWESRINPRPSEEDHLHCALNAYASRQSTLNREWIQSFAQAWIPMLRDNGLSSTWIQPYFKFLPSTASTPGKALAETPKKANEHDYRGDHVDFQGSLVDSDNGEDDDNEQGHKDSSDDEEYEVVA